MIGHLYTLLFLGSPAPPPAPPENSGGWTWNPPEPPWRRKKRDEEDKPAEVAPEAPAVERLPLPSGQLSPAATRYLESLRRQIAEAERQQEIARQTLAAEVATAQAEAARAELQAAIEAERIARQQMRNMDIAFVVAVLAEL